MFDKWMRIGTGMGWVVCLLGFVHIVNAGAEPQSSCPISNPFFAFCMDTHDSQKRTLEEQANLLQEVGFAGAGHLWLEQIPERIQSLQSVGLKLFQIYVRINLAPDANPAYDPKLKEIIPLLEEQGTMLAVQIGGGKPSDESLDARAVELLKEISGMAQASNLQVALYPHVGDWLERVEDAMRLLQKVDRPNLGVMFNLCHWLRVSPDRDYASLLEKAMPVLFAVSIHGADAYDDQPGWSKYIQPLGKGSFDMLGFLQTLHRLNYQGPIGLMGYGIEGDARDVLTQSMNAWKTYTSQLVSEPEAKQ